LLGEHERKSKRQSAGKKQRRVLKGEKGSSYRNREAMKELEEGIPGQQPDLREAMID